MPPPMTGPASPADGRDAAGRGEATARTGGALTALPGRATPARGAVVLAIASAVAATAVVGALVWRRGIAAAPRNVRLAVLPFQNLTGDAGQEFLSDGLTEELITELG